MPQLRTSERVVQELVRRFLSLLKPQECPFTKLFPAELEENPQFISAIVFLLEQFGLGWNDDIPKVLQDAYRRDIAADFISVVKLERPDALYFFATTFGVIKEE